MKAIFLLAFLSIAYMQEVGPDWSDEAKATYYQTERISPEKALMLQFVNLPFANLGYAYSDNWKRGFKWDLAIIGALVLSATIEDDDCGYDYWGNYYCTDDDDELSTMLGLAALGISIYKLVDVYNTAEKYNDNLYKRVFNGQRPYFSMNYSNEKGALLSMNIPLN